MNKAIIELTKEVRSLKEKDMSRVSRDKPVPSNDRIYKSTSPEPRAGHRQHGDFPKDMFPGRYTVFHVSIK